MYKGSHTKHPNIELPFFSTPFVTQLMLCFLLGNDHKSLNMKLIYQAGSAKTLADNIVLLASIISFAI